MTRSPEAPLSDSSTLSKSITSHECIGRSIFDDTFMTPLMFVKDTAVSNNIDRMSRYLRDTGVSIAPHAKTAMAPSLFMRQLDAGAWAMTAATISQVRVLREYGVQRILLANQLVDPAAIRWVANSNVGASRFEFMSFVDSVRGVRILGEIDEGVSFDVLLEVGALGARTGVRNMEEALAVARAIHETHNVRLVGVAGYEGSIAGRDDDPLLEVDEYLESMKGVAVRLSELGLFDDVPEVVITAGGSMYFDRVVDILGEPWSLSSPTRLVLRCGSYVTYDSGRYLTSSPFADRVKEYGPPEPALELWATVQSRPEPTLALMDFGRRDVPFDDGLPVAVAGRTQEGHALTVDGLVVRDLNDQHAFVSVPADHPVQVGDKVGFGVRHPCTAFDKWRLLPIVDDDYLVLDLIETRF